MHWIPFVTDGRYMVHGTVYYDVVQACIRSHTSSPEDTFPCLLSEPSRILYVFVEEQPHESHVVCIVVFFNMDVCLGRALLQCACVCECIRKARPAMHM